MAPPDDAALAEFLDIAFDALCRRHARDLVDPDRVLAALDRALEPSRFAIVQKRVLEPLRTRLLTRAAASTVALGAWLPSDVTDTLVALLARPIHIPRKVIDDAVATEQVRESVKAMLNDALTNFLKGSSSSGGGLGAAVGWGARAMGAAGRGLLGGIGEGIQKQLQDRVRDFVDGSVATMQKKIADRLASEETASTLGKRRAGAFRSLLSKRESDAAKVFARVDWATIDPNVPKVIAHNLARAELREAIVAEVRAVLDDLSRGTIGELLDEMGLRDIARDAVRAHGLPIARDVFGSDAYAAWRKKHSG